MTFVFYDTETTGLETAFDQILQFAAIRTDDDFNELDRFEIRCRLRADVVPSPEALVITRVSPTQLIDIALPSHYEAIVQVRNKLISWSPAVFVGYNSIGFDEDLLRQALFQTLHPAYLTNTDGNSRGDVMKMVHAASVYTPNSIAVPIADNGKKTFKLDHIAPSNGYKDHDAHDAMGDVLATIHMASLVKQRSAEVWEAMLLTTSKHEAIDFVIDEPMVALTDRFYSKSYSWLVTYCGQNSGYNAQLGVFDLTNDPADYINLPVEDLITLLNKSPKVIRSLATNRQPILMHADRLPADAKAASFSQEELMRRVALIRENGDFQERVGLALAGRYADEPASPYVEKRIHDGFPSDEDRALMDQFHQLQWERRLDLVEQFTDQRLRELGQKLIYLERPNVLPRALHKQIRDGIVERMFSDDASVPWTTVPKALESIEKLLSESIDDAGAFLEEVHSYLLKLSSGDRS